MTRIAIVGLGFMGAVHLEAYSAVPGTRVVAGCDLRIDTDPQALTASKGNVKSGAAVLDDLRLYTDLDSMLRAGGFEVVDVCLPTFLHREATLKALAAGHHVFVEKPIALTVEDALAMTQAAEQAGRLLCVAHCIRYWPCYAWLADVIRHRHYGALKSARFERHSPVPQWSWNNWLQSVHQSGGPIIDMHIHDADFINWVLGPPESVMTTGDNRSDPMAIQTIYRYRDISVSAAASFWDSDSLPFRMSASCLFDDAAVEIDGTADQPLRIVGRDGPIGAPEFGTADAYELELTDFVRCVREGTSPEVMTPESAVASLDLVIRERQSIREGREVGIRERLG